MNLAAVDLGSNSFRLEIGRVDGAHIERQGYWKETVRLAAGLDESQKLSKKSIEIALETLARMNERLRGMPPQQVRAVGTQTLRLARNVNDFLLEAQNVLGYPLEVISGREQARLVFEGCMHTLPPSNLRRLKFSELEASDLIKQTSEVLSVLSRNVSIVSAPKLVGTVLKHIEFIKISRSRILVIFVSQSGFVENRIIEDRDDIAQDELDKYTNYLGEILVGVSLEQVRGKIAEEMKNEKAAYDRLLSRALELTQKVFGKEKEPELFMEGQVNLLECPEFSEVGTMKTILQALEEKKLLLYLLDKTMDAVVMTGKGVFQAV